MQSKFQPNRFDKNISREEYFEKNNWYPEDRGNWSQLNQRYSGVSGGAVGVNRPYGQYMPKSSYSYGERMSEPWGRFNPDVQMTYSKPMRFTGQEDPTFIDKSMPEREFRSERKQPILGKKYFDYNYSSRSTPSKRFGGVHEPIDERDFFNPTILRPNTYLNRVAPSNLVVGTASDLFTSVGMRPKPVGSIPSQNDFTDDPSEIVEALIKVQRVNPVTGVAESFHEEGLTTTLRIHRRMLTDHGLKSKDEGILAFLKRKEFDLDKIIDFSTRNQIKRTIGLGPLDNIKLELLPDSTFSTNYPHSTFSTNYPHSTVGQVFRRSPIAGQDRGWSDRQFSSVGGEGFYRERIPMGRSAFVGGAVSGAFNERKSYDYHDGYYGRGVNDWQERESVEPKKPSMIKETIEGIKCAIQGPKYHLKHPEITPSTKSGMDRWGRIDPNRQQPMGYENGTYERRGEEWRDKGYVDRSQIDPRREYPMNLDDRTYERRGDEWYDRGYVDRSQIDPRREYPMNLDDRTYERREDEWYDNETMEPKKPSMIKRTIEGIKSAVKGSKHHTKHPEITSSTNEPVMDKWGNQSMGYENRNYGYKVDRPVYSSNQSFKNVGSYYDGNRSVGQRDYYDKGYVDRQQNFDQGFSQRTEVQNYRY